MAEEAKKWAERSGIDRWADVRAKAKEIMASKEFVGRLAARAGFKEDTTHLFSGLLGKAVQELVEMSRNLSTLRGSRMVDQDRDMRYFSRAGEMAEHLRKVLLAVDTIANSAPTQDIQTLDVQTSKGFAGFGKKREKVMDILKGSEQLLNDVSMTLTLIQRVGRTMAQVAHDAAPTFAIHQGILQEIALPRGMQQLAGEAILEFNVGVTDLNRMIAQTQEIKK